MPLADDFLGPESAKSADSFLDDHSNIVNKSLSATMTSPFKLPPQKSFTEPMGYPPTPDPIPWDPQEQQLAQHGVDITSGAPVGLRQRLSLLVSPTDEEKRSAINQYFGIDVGLAKNREGQLEYTNPETGRRTLLESHGADLKGLVPTVGGTTDAVLSGGGAALAGSSTAIATGNPVLAAGAATVGGAAGQAVADLGKTLVNSILGTGNKKTPKETALNIGSDALKTGALTAAGEAVGMVPAGARFIGRGFLDLKYGKAIDLQAKAAEATASRTDYFNLLGSLPGNSPSIPELIPKEPLPRMWFDKARGTTPELTAEEEKRINSNLDSMSYLYKNVTDTYKPSPNYMPGSSGEGMKGAVDQQKQLALSQQMLQDAFAKANAKRTAMQLPPYSTTEMNQMGTDMLNTVEQAGKQKKDQAYGDLKVMLGAPKEVAYDRGSSYWLIDRKAEDTVEMSPVAKAKIQNMYNEGVRLQKSPLRSGDKYFSAIPEDFYTDVNKPELGLNFNDKKYDIFSLIDNIQDLHSGTRSAMAASKGRIPADEQANAHVADILQDEVEYYLGRKGDPRILDQWENAKQATQEYEENFGRGILANVMHRTGGFQDPVYNSFVNSLLLRGGRGQDQTGVSKLSEVLKGDPEANENVRNMIWATYRDHFMPSDGIPTRESFSKFKDQMEGPIKYFFGHDDLNKMTTFEQMTDDLQASTKKLTNFNKSWQKNPEFGGIPSTSQGLSDAVFRKSVSPQALGRMTAFLQNSYPELLQEWRADTAARFARETSDANGTPIAGNITKKIGDLGDRLTMMMDPLYVTNVRTIARESQMAMGNPGVRLDPEKPKSILTQVVRAAFAPPLSEEGRWYTALLGWRDRAAGRVVYNALKDPQSLNEFIRNTAYSAAKPTVAGVFANLKGRALYQYLNQSSNDQQQPVPQETNVP